MLWRSTLLAFHEYIIAVKEIKILESETYFYVGEYCVIRVWP